jgi:hypothetical protein
MDRKGSNMRPIERWAGGWQSGGWTPTNYAINDRGEYVRWAGGWQSGGWVPTDLRVDGSRWAGGWQSGGWTPPTLRP